MRHALAALLLAALALACGATETPGDGGTEAGSDASACCPIVGGGSCAYGGSRRLNPSCGFVACDCLMITGTTNDADGCPVQTFVSGTQYCAMFPRDAGPDVDAASDAPADAPGEGG